MRRVHGDVQPIARIREKKKMDNKSVIALVAFLQSSAICLGQASLKMNSVAFFQLTKQMQVPLVAVVEYFFLSRTVSRTKYCCSRKHGFRGLNRVF